MRLLTILIRKFVLERLRCYKVKYFKTIKLREEANSKTKIIVSFVEQKENSHEVEDFKDYRYKEC